MITEPPSANNVRTSDAGTSAMEQPFFQARQAVTPAASPTWFMLTITRIPE